MGAKTIKKITLLEIAEAIQMNGYPKKKGGFGNQAAACAIGQGAINLGVDAYSLEAALNTLNICGLTKASFTAATAIENLNDSTEMSVGEIGKKLSKFAESWPDLEFEVTTREW